MRVTVTSDKYYLVNSYSSLILSFCGNLSFRSVFFVNSRLNSFINAIFQVIVCITLFYNSNTKFPLIMFIKFNLNSNCIFRIISDIRRVIHLI